VLTPPIIAVVQRGRRHEAWVIRRHALLIHQEHHRCDAAVEGRLHHVLAFGNQQPLLATGALLLQAAHMLQRRIAVRRDAAEGPRAAPAA